jgi:methylated-DNA-[protein]-cysteine S-methyltransferase
MNVDLEVSPTITSDTAQPGAERRLIVDSPIGPLALGGDDRSVTHLFLPDTGPASAKSSPGATPATLRRAATQLDEYFAGTRTAFDLPFELRGTPFQVDVWEALADIDYGTTITYGELARWVGRPTAFRAVGQANGANPLPIFFPCHRVVASGGLGGYGGGLGVKRQLLALEGWSAEDRVGVGVAHSGDGDDRERP